MEDTNKELERLERELLAEETDPLEDEELLALLKEDTEPAFDDPTDFGHTDEPVRNFSNDYGQEPASEPEQPPEDAKKKKDDKVIIGLLITASALCLGILGVLVYWMEAFIR